jgi:hypothetical protein
VVVAAEPSEGVEHVGLVRRTTFRLVGDEVGDRDTTIGDHDRLAGLSTARERAAGTVQLTQAGVHDREPS